MTYDVIVVGVGGMGSAAAYHLAARGRRVLGLERFSAGHDRGSSHGRSRVIRQGYHEHPSYVPLVVHAYDLWQKAERDSGCELLTVTGGITVGGPETEVVAGSRRSAEKWGLPYEVLDTAEVHRRFPTLTPRQHEVGLYEPNTGFVRPEESVLAHSRLATEAGAELRYGERVTGWTGTSAGVEVTTTTGTYSAGQLLFCAGAWSSSLLPDLGVPMVVERQVMHWFEPTGGIESFRDHPVFLLGDSDDEFVYGFPAHDGEETVKVAFYRRPHACQPDDVDRTVSAAEVEEIRAFLEPRMPGLAGRHVAAKTCLYTMTPDHDFVIGRHPGHENVVVACGFSGHGFKFVPVVGEVLADLVVDGDTEHDIGLFEPTRFLNSPRVSS